MREEPIASCIRLSIGGRVRRSEKKRAFRVSLQVSNFAVRFNSSWHSLQILASAQHSRHRLSAVASHAINQRGSRKIELFLGCTKVFSPLGRSRCAGAHFEVRCRALSYAGQISWQHATSADSCAHQRGRGTRQRQADSKNGAFRTSKKLPM